MLIPSKALFPLSVFLFLCAGCAGTEKGVLQDLGLTYESRARHVRLALPRMAGWETSLMGRDSPLPKSVVFGAVHQGKLVNVILSVEPLNSDLEDYLLIIREANEFDKRPGYQDMGRGDITLNGQPAVKFVYRADVDMAGGKGDSLDLKTYVYTNVLMKYNEFNVWLEISTRGEAYERKGKLIEDIYEGLEVLK